MGHRRGHKGRKAAPRLVVEDQPPWKRLGRSLRYQLQAVGFTGLLPGLAPLRRWLSRTLRLPILPSLLGAGTPARRSATAPASVCSSSSSSQPVSAPGSRPALHFAVSNVTAVRWRRPVPWRRVARMLLVLRWRIHTIKRRSLGVGRQVRRRKLTRRWSVVSEGRSPGPLAVRRRGTALQGRCLFARGPAPGRRLQRRSRLTDRRRRLTTSGLASPGRLHCVGKNRSR